MPDYVTPPLVVDAEDLFQTLFVPYMQAQNPLWVPIDAEPDTQIGEAVAEMAADLGMNATDVMSDMFRYFGAYLANVPPLAAVAASGTATFTVDVTTGYTVPAGTTIGKDPGDGSFQQFATTQDGVVAVAATTVSVPVVAVATGVIGNGLSGAATLVDSLAHVTGVAFDAPTAGGADAEDGDVYNRRLTRKLALQAPRPILPADFAEMAKDVLEVDRACVFDLYNPADGTSNNYRMVTVVAVNTAGTALSGAGATALGVLFNGDGVTVKAKREVNFVVNVVNGANYTAVDVAFTATARTGYDPAVVKANAQAAVSAYVSPTNWGQTNLGENRIWENEPLVRQGRIFDVLYGVDGIRTVTAVTLGLSGGALSAADYTLPVTNAKPAPMPTAGTITGTVT